MAKRVLMAAATVLVLVGVMATPSWAANQPIIKGNNPRLCEPGGYAGALLNQRGEAFKNVAACVKYAENGGRLVGVAMVAGSFANEGFDATCSGLGLHAGVAVCAIRYEGSDFAGSFFFATVPANGSFSAAVPPLPESTNQPCTVGDSKPFSLLVAATTAQGVEFRREFPFPSGC